MSEKVNKMSKSEEQTREEDCSKLVITFDRRLTTLLQTRFEAAARAGDNQISFTNVDAGGFIKCDKVESVVAGVKVCSVTISVE